MTRVKAINQNQKLNLDGKFEINFDPSVHLLFHKKKVLAYHTNGMMFSAHGKDNQILL